MDAPQTALMDEGRAGQALTVRRRFTTPGVHPFDSVEWELRDARIGHGDRVAFEQTGVEFPATWSQNATNIVAQKYFRGQLGSPARERSVKQMISRVAGTIADWGRQRGYFATPDDGDTFEAELTYVLLHQMAAFNSPVWFNVGFEESPQCSACQPYSALVSTPEGMVPIGQLVEDDMVGREVYDANGTTRIVATKANGIKSVFRVRLRNGSFIEATADHVVKTVGERRAEPQWLRVDELEVGMRMHLHPHRAKVAAAALVPAGPDDAGVDEVAATVAAADPVKVSEAALAGWLQADGFVGQYVEGTNRSLTVEFQVASEEERAWVEGHLAVALPDVHRKVRDADTQTQPVQRIRLYGEVLRPFVERFDLLDRGSEIRVPWRLWTAPHEEIAAYLRSLFQADGYVTVRRDRGCENAKVGFAVIGERWTEDVQILLGVLGIYSRRLHKAEKRADRHDLHEVFVSIGSERARFAELVGFVDARKQGKLLASLELRNAKRCPDLREEEIVAVEPLGEMEVYDIQTQSGEYLSNNIAVHNCFILSVDDTMESILDWNTREGRIFRGGSGSGINLSNIRGSMEPLSKGGTASGPVSFMRGADAWAGTIKCLAEGTEIMTPRGAVAIEDVQPGDEVLTRRGTRSVTAAHSNGIKPLVKIVTELGDEVTCTAEHRFWVRTHEGEELWREAGSIRPDDHLTLDLGAVEFGELQPMKDADRGHHNERALVLPQVLHADFARWLGWIYGDGSITDRPPARYVGVQIGDSDSDLVPAYRELVARVFGEQAHLFTNVKPAGRDASCSVRLASTQLVRWLKDNHLAKDKAPAVHMPVAIKSSPSEVRAAFLSGLFEADGSIVSGYPTLATVSSRLALDVHRLLLSLGVPSKLRRVDDRSGAFGTLPLYTVRVVSLAGVARFEQFIGFVSARKRQALSDAVAAKSRCVYETDWVYPHAAQDVNELCEKGDAQLRRALSAYCRTDRPRSLSAMRATALLNEHRDLCGSVIERAASPYTYFTRATVEPVGVGKVFDITVDDAHEYLVDNLVTHNSGGKTRRAAKMVVLDVDHPDIRDFIWCKAREEDKAEALAKAGFDMSIDGEGFTSIQYQNANNSVRVSDAFMHAVENDAEWCTIARQTGEPVGEPVPARELMRQIAEAAWRCADPGVQYDTTINQWHTSPESGRINASNPCCFTGETLVHTTEGTIRFDELHERYLLHGEAPSVVAYDRATGQAGLEPVSAVWVAGLTHELIEVITDDDVTLRCTPEHRFLVADGRYVEAQFLGAGTTLRAGSLAPLLVHAGASTGKSPRARAGTTRVDAVRWVSLDTPVPVYDLEVPSTSNFAVTSDGSAAHGVIVHNSEYMHVDDSACNLASLNLMKFRRADGTFDVEVFEHAVDIMFLAQEIVVGPSSYPTEEIGINARAFRQLGLGYANLGAFLMANGMPYDSDEGRGTAAAITALMTGRAYLDSARIAAAIGAYERYGENREPHNAVMRMHRDASYAIPDSTCTDTALLSAARGAWDDAVAVGEEHGYRNAQATVLAPTGTISFLLDCDTTGVEPDFSLVKFKELVGGGRMTIANRTVPLALETLGYTGEQIAEIEAYITANATIVGAPGLAPEHLEVFDVAVGERAISHMGHIKMMGAVQPFISGAISKTVNLPQTATVEDIADAYIQAWHMGVKALAIYRDGSKTAQALRTEAQGVEGAAGDGGFTQEQVDVMIAQAVDGAVAEAVAEAREEGRSEALRAAGPARKRMPRERRSITHKFSIAGHEGYITAGMYEDGTLGEIFLTDIGKEGSTLRGLLNSFATAISIALQYGVPLETLVSKFCYMRFEPEGITQNPEIPFAKSMPDYIMRWLASRFLDVEAQEELGILTPEVRARRSAEEAASSQGSDTAGPPRPATGRDAESDGDTPTAQGSEVTTAPPTQALTDTPPVLPARLVGLDLGPACNQCGGMMQRTGSCYTCSSCGNNTGCG